MINWSRHTPFGHISFLFFCVFLSQDHRIFTELNEDWGCYASISQLKALHKWLDRRGVRERVLKVTFNGFVVSDRIKRHFVKLALHFRVTRDILIDKSAFLREPLQNLTAYEITCTSNTDTK